MNREENDMASQDHAHAASSALDARAKHTPGPWEVHEVCDGHEILMGDAIETPYAYESHNRLHYDHGCEHDTEGSDAHAQYEQAVANAHLIAAAPGLLEALKGLVDVGARFTGEADEDAATWVAADALARAAIARAEGLAPSSAEQVVQPIRDEPLSPNTSA